MNASELSINTRLFEESGTGEILLPKKDSPPLTESIAAAPAAVVEVVFVGW